MMIRKFLDFVFWWVIFGLALAFLAIVLRPELLQTRQATIQVTEHVTPAGTQNNTAWSGPISYSAAVEKAAPAVVNIHTAKVVVENHPFANDPIFARLFGNRYSQQRKRLKTSLGSGVIISPEGYVLTNHHVVAGADEIKVLLSDSRSVSASVVGSDPDTDLAVLHISLDSLPIMTIGDSDHIRVGDVMLAIGNPFGVGQTVTQGIVSATGRDQIGLNTFENFIQTDAAINPGNSGGALVNAHGDLIGINSAIFSQSGGSQGIGFAIPVNQAKAVMTEIIEHGTVVRGWLGVEAQDLTRTLAASFGLKEPKGILIAGIWRNGPADRAGLRPGDILLEMNKRPVVNAHTMMKLIAAMPPGKTIEVIGIRDKQGFQATLEVIQRPPQKN